MPNCIVISGNLVADPEVKDAGSAKVCNATIANNRTYKHKKTTSFIDVRLWGAQAESFCQFMSKGSPTHITGYLQQERWESSDGGKRSKLIVVATGWEFGAPKGKSVPRETSDYEPERDTERDTDDTYDDDEVPF